MENVLLNRYSNKIEPGSYRGYLRVLEDTGKTIKTYKIWKCLCERCGNICEKSTENLKTARSCGCYRKDRMFNKVQPFVNSDKCGMSNSLRNKPNKNKTSCDIRGVTWSKDKKKWSVHIMHKSKNYFLGYYELLNDAGYIRKQAEEAVKNNVFDEWYTRYKESKR